MLRTPPPTKLNLLSHTSHHHVQGERQVCSHYLLIRQHNLDRLGLANTSLLGLHEAGEVSIERDNFFGFVVGLRKKIKGISRES
jgi:hypothetical protein